ncbi:DUF523 and DUF1722 domain-containing protein [Ketobacter sp.]
MNSPRREDAIELHREPDERIPVGLSACLAGQPVRFNGGASQSKLCLQQLSKYFSYQTFCPEMAAGFGTPRPAMRLVGQPDSPTLTYSNRPGVNLSARLRQGFAGKLDQFAELDGYILMKNSPSCGLERIKVYQPSGYPHEQRVSGLFTAALKAQYPQLPLEEEGRLHDAKLCENFILRVYAHRNFRVDVLDQPTPKKLITFHSRYKYLLMAHNQAAYKSLGKLLANIDRTELDQLLPNYFAAFMEAISKPADARNHSNALMHVLGYLKNSVPSQARQNIESIIHQYRQGIVPLVAPLTLLNHYIRQYGNDYIRSQYYLSPYPESLGLANRLF